MANSQRLSRLGGLGQLCLALLVALLRARHVTGDVQSATDVFASPCPMMKDPPPQGFLRWSSPATWPGNVVPGVGAAANQAATIPCGEAVLLDVPNITLSLLHVQGFLKFYDDPSVGNISVTANYILVEGQLSIGEEAKQFSRHVAITLTPAPGRAPLLFSSFAPADPSNPRLLGHKVFAVVGGQVNIHGVPGGGSTPMWCQLARTANAGDTSIMVDKNVAGLWPVGGEIVVATTDFDQGQTEVFKITSVTAVGLSSVIGLSQAVQWMHWGSPVLPDGFGGNLNQRAEVGLLTRNVLMTATDEPAPYNLEGGHLIIFQTQIPQYIEGLESRLMGQQGQLGRYPIHFHLCGSHPNSYVRKNAIRNTKQRCCVIHATHDITVSGNVAHNTTGHCFMIEDGGEHGNKFLGNLGVTTNAAAVLIPDVSGETDNTPSTFWITNLNNTYIGNTAAGSTESGFWMELREAVRGPSLLIPSINATIPFNTVLAVFTQNTAHSNGGAGFRTYPHGNRPRLPDGSRAQNFFTQLTSYKNELFGLFTHNTDQLWVQQSTFADNNGFGLHMLQDEAITVQSSTFVAKSQNYGNPTQCWRTDIWSGCEPASGCINPPPAGVPGRSVAKWRGQPQFGVYIDQSARWDSGLYPNYVQNCRFSGYSSSCSMQAAVALGGDAADAYWNTAHTLSGLVFDAGSTRIQLLAESSPIQPSGPDNPLDGGEQAQFYAIRDEDASILAAPGYIVANNPRILPPVASVCTFKPDWNAYACPGTCYRSLMVDFQEPAWTPGTGRKHGDYSYIVITRVDDGKVLTLDGNMNFNDGSFGPNTRFFGITLLAGMTYELAVRAGANSGAAFQPAAINIQFRDNHGCGTGLTIRVPNAGKQQWTLAPARGLSYSPCPGAATPSPSDSSFQYVCANAAAAPVATIAFGAASSDVVTLVPGTASCSSISQCTLFKDHETWAYDDDGTEQRPLFYQSPIAPLGWKTGLAPLGYVGYGSYISTQTQPVSQSRITYFFRRNFTVSNTACYSALNVGILISTGVVVYLNGVEVLRNHMPAGAVTSQTLSSGYCDFFNNTDGTLNYTMLTVPLDSSRPYALREGANLIAVESHAFATYAWQFGFDMRLTANWKGPSCTGSLLGGKALAPARRSTPPPPSKKAHPPPPRSLKSTHPHPPPPHHRRLLESGSSSASGTM